MANTIIVKKGAGIPSPESLQEAELALDVVDGSLYTKLNDGDIHQLNDGADDVDLSDYVTEAPIDTKQYARQDGAWSEVVIPDGGTGSSVHIGQNPPQPPIAEGQQWMEIPADGDAVMWVWDGEKWLQQPGSGGSGGGLEDAPGDGEFYARQSGAWAQIPETDLSDYYTSTGADGKFQPKGDYIEDAPSDGELYVRKDGAWELYTPSSGGGGDNLMEAIVQPTVMGNFTLDGDQTATHPMTYASPYERPATGDGTTYTLTVPAGMHFVLMNINSKQEYYRKSTLIIDGVRMYPGFDDNIQNKYFWPGEGWQGKPNFIVRDTLQINGISASNTGHVIIYGFCIPDGSARTAALQDAAKRGREAIATAKEAMTSTQEVADE